MLRKHIAVDLGTANTLVFVQSQGIVINEPSVVAVDTINERVIAVGKEAKDYIGKTPQRISTIRPLRDGVIADFDAAQALIATFLKKVIGSWSIKPDVVICVPTNITDVERRAVAEAATKAGARNVKLIEEPVAAAVGAGLPVLDPVGSMVVDIGGGTTDIAVITLGSMACSTSLKLAGDALTAAVQRFVREKYQIVVGENMAERIKTARCRLEWRNRVGIFRVHHRKHRIAARIIPARLNFLFFMGDYTLAVDLASSADHGHNHAHRNRLKINLALFDPVFLPDVLVRRSRH